MLIIASPDHSKAILLNLKNKSNLLILALPSMVQELSFVNFISFLEFGSFEVTVKKDEQ